MIMSLYCTRIWGEFDVTLAEDGTQRVAGVVSTETCDVMNSSCEGEHIVALALQGIFQKYMVLLRKAICLLVVVMVMQNRYVVIGTVIGKALENFNGTEGLIEVAIGRL